MFFLIVFFMAIFITFIRRQWYRKKRFTIPICLLTTVFIGAIIIGSVLGARSKNGTGMIFYISFSSKVDESSFYKSSLPLHIYSKILNLLNHKGCATFVSFSSSHQIFFKLIPICSKTFMNHKFWLKSRKTYRWNTSFSFYEKIDFAN